MNSSPSQHCNAPQAVHLKDYRPPAFLIPEIELDFDLFEEHAYVSSVLKIKRSGSHQEPLVLNGERLKLMELKLNGKPLAPSSYQLDETHLTIPNVPDTFTLEALTQIHPQENKALEGLYRSGEIFCTQNESEGFRKITYFLDRPDVMSRYTTRIAADKEKYPVLLSGGNLIEKGSLPGGRHFVKWRNPFSMPCYLFALVAGHLGKTEDFYTTKSGRKVALQIFVDRGNEHKCAHAMDALKKSMKWDEDTFGLEYDLDIYMIVAVDAFNFGAMENKGLNIFNSQYILADPKTATDQNYEGVQSVVGHEYFHNWTGNRVTCRDWFQVTLKEGLTVFREQEFTADMTSRAVKRINDARRLRDYQFPEDAGPNAHPIRPPSYIEINNFYTVTVYEKGSEVIRMIQTLIGRENFKKGITKYFELFDGQAVTTDDFVKAMELASGMDLTQFRNWYSQAGTPTCKVTSLYDAAKRTLTLTIEQRPGGGPPEKKEPFYFPFQIGLLDEAGKNIPLSNDGILTVSKPSETFTIENTGSKPVLSLLRNFSAPVKLETDQTREDYLFLLSYDTDTFNRYDAGQKLAESCLREMIAAVQAGSRPFADTAVLDAFGRVLEDESLDPAFLAEMITMPSQTALLQGMAVYDFDAVFTAREIFMKQMAQVHEKKFRQIYKTYHSSSPYSPDRESIGKRLLKNKALGYLLYLETPETADLALQQFEKATNMTDEIYALAVLCQTPGTLRDPALEKFYSKWQKDALVMNKWFAVQADSKQPDTLNRVRVLEKNTVFDFKNPNKVRSLIGVFSGNLVRFHSLDGEGYAHVADKILEIDPFNPSVAAHLASAYKYYAKAGEKRQALMKVQLERILKTEKISANTFEIVSKTLKSV